MKQTMSKRILSLFLALIMTLGLLPMGALASPTLPDTLSIYFTMSNEGNLQLSQNGTDGLARLPMEIPIGSTAVDALKEAHKQHYETGESGYAESGGNFSRFWGITTINLGYFVNGTMVTDLSAPLTEGADREACIYNDYTSDLYTRFSKQALSIAPNQPTELTLLYNTITTPDWSGGMMGGETATLPLSGASILIGDAISCGIPYDDSNSWLTDANGTVSVSFDSQGTYYLSAAKENTTLIPAICKITVADEATIAAVSADKAALKFAAIKGANTASTDVTQDLVLPTSGQSGQTTITWTSDKTDFIKHDGTVLRPAVGSQNQTVTLTATISYGSVTDTETITVTVSALPSPAEILNEVSDSLPATLTPNQWDGHTKNDTNIIVMLRALVQAINPAVLVADSCIPTEQTQISTDGTITYGASSATKPVTFTLQLGEVTKDLVLSIQVDAHKPNPQGDVPELAAFQNNIAAYYAQKPAQWWGSEGSWWHALGMRAYQSYTGGTKNVISPEAKQAFVNKTIAAISKGDSNASSHAGTLATSINGLCAMGYDPTALWTVNKTKLDAVSTLKTIKLEDAKNDWYYYTAPYVLTSLNQGTFDSSAQEQAYVAYLLEELPNAVDFVDASAMILHGLSYYYNQAEVKTAVDAAITVLSAKQTENGSYGDANTDAVVILALSQLGIRSDSDSRFVRDGNSLLDGLLRYKISSNDGFGYQDATARNDLATKQGFLALIAASEVISTGEAYDAFSCTAVPKSPAYANGIGTPETPPSPPVGNKDLTVSLSVKVGNQTWIPRTDVTLKKGASVYHAFTTLLARKGFDSTGAEAGYVRSITKPDDTKLSEFDKGPNSGWLYKVNGSLPTIGLTAYELSARDQIVFYFTPDWTKDEAASQVNSGGSTKKPEVPTSDTPATVAPSATVSHGTATATVSTSEANKALESVKKNNKAALVIAPVITGDVTKVAVRVPIDTLVGLANDTHAALTIQSNVARITLSPAALSTISAETGSHASITAQKVDALKLSAENQALVGDHPVYDFSVIVGTKKVTDFKGAVTVSLPYTLKAGESLENLTIYYIDSEGKATEMPGVRYDAATKSIVFETSHFSTFAVAYDESNLVFTDVSPSDWFYSAVKFSLSNKLFSGTSDKTFSPNADMSRAMLFTVLHRMSGAATEQAAETWYSAGMAWAKTEGISDGTNPNGSITREQLVTMLYRYATLQGYDASKTANLSSYTDSGEVSDWAQKALQWAVDSGLITGRTSTTLAPRGTATRAEVALILQRFLASVPK